MMFAFSRDRAVPGHQLWRRSREPRPAVRGLGDRVLAAVLMIPAIWNYLVGYAVGTAIAVIGLYIAFVIPVYPPLPARRPLRAAAPGASAGTTSGSTRSRSVWVALITILFVFPLYKVGLPWEDDFTWEFTNYTILWFAGIGLVFGGWWFLSAKNWFKGPCDGHRGGARADGGGAARRVRAADRGRRASRSRVRGQRAPSGRGRPQRLRNAGSAAVRRSRSKCSAA